MYGILGENFNPTNLVKPNVFEKLAVKYLTLIGNTAINCIFAKDGFSIVNPETPFEQNELLQ